MSNSSGSQLVKARRTRGFGLRSWEESIRVASSQESLILIVLCAPHDIIITDNV